MSRTLSIPSEAFASMASMAALSNTNITGLTKEQMVDHLTRLRDLLLQVVNIPPSLPVLPESTPKLGAGF